MLTLINNQSILLHLERRSCSGAVTGNHIIGLRNGEQSVLASVKGRQCYGCFATNALGSLRVSQAQSSGLKKTQLAIKHGIKPNFHRLARVVGGWATTTIGLHEP